MDVKLLSCILLMGCWMVTLAQVPSDCCLTVGNMVIPKARVVDYQQQLGGQGCAIDATILVTRHGKKLCAPLEGHWIDSLIKHVDKLKKFCKAKHYKPKRCFGVIHEGNTH